MTLDEFLSNIKSRGGFIAPPVTQTQITLTDTTLQALRLARLPLPVTELYSRTGGLFLGTGYIFGPDEVKRGPQYPIPSIIKINQDLPPMDIMRGKTVFGRNDLFWFAFDCFGAFYMLDNLTLRVLRKYDNAYRTMYDCLIGGIV